MSLYILIWSQHVPNRRTSHNHSSGLRVYFLEERSPYPMICDLKNKRTCGSILGDCDFWDLPRSTETGTFLFGCAALAYHPILCELLHEYIPE